MDLFIAMVTEFVENECPSLNASDPLYNACEIGEKLLKEISTTEAYDSENTTEGADTVIPPTEFTPIEDPDEPDTVLLVQFYSILGFGLASLLIILIVMLMERRKTCCPRCQGGYFALVIPVNFLEDRSNRLTIVAAFGLIAIDVIDLLQGSSEMFAPLNVYEKVFARILLVLFICIVFMPLFICFTASTYVSLVLGLVYTLLYVGVRIYVVLYDDIIGAPKNVIVAGIVTEMMIIGFGTATIYGYCLKMYEKVKKQSLRPALYKFQRTHLKNLLCSKKQINTGVEQPKGKCLTCWEKNVYYNTKGFRYSLSILISTTVGAVMVTYFLIKMLSLMILLHDLLEIVFHLDNKFLELLKHFTVPNILQIIAKKLFKATFKISWTITIFDFLYDQYCIIFGSVFGSFGITYLLYLLTTLHMLKSYKENVQSLHNQQTSSNLLAGKTDNPVALVISAVQYCGYQVAYFLWGVAVQWIFLSVVLIILCEILILPVKYGTWAVIIAIGDKILPILIIMILTKGVQWILVKFVFVQDRGTSLGLDNRKAFYNMMYFMFFYNIFLGIFSCLIRIIKTLIFGVWFLPRLDRSIFPKTFEHMDNGFKCYTCLLKLENLQSNIIVVAAANILLKNDVFGGLNKASQKNALPDMELNRSKQRLLARNRWLVAYTLLKNPQLKDQRGRQIPHDEVNDILEDMNDKDSCKKQLITSV